jgi:hypothetical protein
LKSLQWWWILELSRKKYVLNWRLETTLFMYAVVKVVWINLLFMNFLYTTANYKCHLRLTRRTKEFLLEVNIFLDGLIARRTFRKISFIFVEAVVHMYFQCRLVQGFNSCFIMVSKDKLSMRYFNHGSKCCAYRIYKLIVLNGRKPDVSLSLLVVSTWNPLRSYPIHQSNIHSSVYNRTQTDWVHFYRWVRQQQAHISCINILDKISEGSFLFCNK